MQVHVHAWYFKMLRPPSNFHCHWLFTYVTSRTSWWYERYKGHFKKHRDNWVRKKQRIICEKVFFYYSGFHPAILCHICMLFRFDKMSLNHMSGIYISICYIHCCLQFKIKKKDTWTWPLAISVQFIQSDCSFFLSSEIN